MGGQYSAIAIQIEPSEQYRFSELRLTTWASSTQQMPFKASNMAFRRLSRSGLTQGHGLFFELTEAGLGTLNMMLTAQAPSMGVFAHFNLAMVFTWLVKSLVFLGVKVIPRRVTRARSLPMGVTSRVME